MKKSLILLGVLSMATAYAQEGRVGINTENPNATLEVAGVPTNTKVLDGIIAPRITGNQLKAKTYTADQTGALVYVTEPATTANQTGQTINVAGAGYYYFDGSVWQIFKAGDTDTNNLYTAGTGIAISDDNVISRTGFESVGTGTNRGWRLLGTNAGIPGRGSVDMMAYNNNNNVQGVTGIYSVGGGFNNSVSANYSAVFGIENNITSNFSLVGGYGNTTESSGSVLMSGIDNTITGSYDAIAIGRGNKIINSSSGSLFGARNILNNARYSFASGERNNVSSQYSLVGGMRNTVENSDGVLMSGIDNTITNSNYNIAIGRGNKIINSLVSSLLGDNNTLNNAHHSFASGLENNVSSLYALVGGYRNTVEKAASSFISGQNNRIISSLAGSLLGDNNTLNNASYSFASGTENNVSSRASLVGGLRNTTEKSEGSFISGEGNRIITNSGYSSIMGRNNKIENGRASSALGDANEIYRSFSVALGIANKTNNISEVALGRYNFNTDEGNTDKDRDETAYRTGALGDNLQFLTIGGGVSTNTRKNLIIVLRNANTGIGLASDTITPANSKPTEMLDVNGNVRVRGAGLTITEGATCTNVGTISLGKDGNFYGCAGTTTLTWKKLHN